MLTERQMRDYELPKTRQDYYDLLHEIDDLGGELAYGEACDKDLSSTARMIVKTLKQKIKLDLKCSKKFRKKQSYLSIKRDLKQEKLEEEIKYLEKYGCSKQELLNSSKKTSFLGKIKALFSRKKPELKQLPTNVEESQQNDEEEAQKEAQNDAEALECEVIEEDTYEDDKSEVMDF